MKRADEIMDAAEAMIREGGYHAFSFREVAAAVGIKSASVHYHYPTKEALGVAVADRYCGRFLARLHELDGEGSDWRVAVRGFAAGFLEAFRRERRVCLCGVLSAEANRLPAAIVKRVSGFIEEVVAWLQRSLLGGGGVEAAEARRLAHLVYASMQGATISSKSLEDDAVLQGVADELVRLIELRMAQ